MTGRVKTGFQPVRLAVLAAALVLGGRAQQAPAPPLPPPSPAELAVERELGHLLNQERVRAGVGELEIDPRVVEAARAHARQMAAHHHLDHQFPGEPVLRLRLAAAGLRFDNAGENVALDDNAAGAHMDFLSSYHHRENMLSPGYNVMGIGVAQSQDQFFIVEDFAYRTREYSPQQAEDAVAAAYLAYRSRAKDIPPHRIDEPRLRERACAMADADKVTPGGLEGLVGARSMVSYNEGRPDRLPPQLTDPARGGSAKAFAVGACFARTPSFPEGVYWIKVALY